jgi:hypothetical protein
VIAALYVDPDGVYSGLEGVSTWGGIDHADGSTTIIRDARDYAGPHPVVAHPSCKRWGRFWHGSTRKPHQYRLGEDGGCFAAALTAVRNYGGVLEHPKDSLAWGYFGLMTPPPTGGWVRADAFDGWTCCVDQGQYGHKSNKRTWLYAVGCDLPSLEWGKGAQRIPEWMIERYGYARARRIGVVAMEGGKDKTRKRNATPEPFRDVLLGMAQSVYALRSAA